MKMDIYKITDLIYREFLGKLSEEERDALDQWINDNERHKQYYEKLFTSYSLDTIKSLDRIDTEAGWQKWNKKYKKKRSIFVYMKYAAVFIILISVSSLAYLMRDDTKNFRNLVSNNAQLENGAVVLTIEGQEKIILGENTPTRLEADKSVNIVADSSNLCYETVTSSRKAVMHTLEIPHGKDFFITLSDSSKVWVNSRTQLRYPSYFEGEKRIVEIEGEAYFEVCKNQNKPFIVRTRGVDIEVLGTRFNVSSYEENSSIVTTLVEGKVKVHVPKAKNSQEVILLPGMQSSYNKKTGETKISYEVNTSLYTAWTQGYFMYESARLEDIMQDVCRWYNLNVVYEDQESRDLQFTGEFKRNDSFEQVLRFLQLTQKVDVYARGNTIYIKSL